VKVVAAFFLLAFAVPSSSQLPVQSVSSQLSRKAKLFGHRSTVVWSCGSSGVEAFVYEAGLAVDADGAFRAYHPNDRLGLDTIEHAGRPGNWWALATDTGKTNGRPVLQRNDDPAPGYYVSMTSLFDASNSDEHDPRRFVDAANIPYVVLPPAGFRHAKLGDFATVVNFGNDRAEGAIVADESAPEVPMGEGSMALAKALGIDSNPRSGGIEHGVAYVIYPGSGNGKPRNLEDIAVNSQRRFERWGGRERLDSCLR
jgi:hypothetical protein